MSYDDAVQKCKLLKGSIVGSTQFPDRFYISILTCYLSNQEGRESPKIGLSSSPARNTDHLVKTTGRNTSPRNLQVECPTI